MGIHLLQTFLTSQRDKNVKEIHLRNLNNKKIAVDISIYLYRFKEMGNLIENMYLMCSIFRYYDIHPIFIFDGKSPTVKQDTINKRKESKQNAKDEFIKLKKNMSNCSFNEKKEMELKLDILRKKFISVKKKDIIQIQCLLDAYGMTYVTANNEADELCGILTLTNTVYACMTEDTDIMAYGARKILRYFSLIKHTVVLYDMPLILQNLHMTVREFQELCVCSGNDYINMSKNIFNYYIF